MDRSELEDEEKDEEKDRSSEEPITLEVQDGFVGGKSTF